MERKRPPVIQTIKEAQDINFQWRRGNGIHTENPIKVAHEGLSGELDELKEAMKKGDTKEIGSELADIALYALALMSLYGMQADELLTAKIDRNFHKYNPVVNQQLRENGDENPMSTLRNLWDREKDKDYI